MILDASGKPYRRSIGFEARMVREETPKANIDVSAVGFSMDCDESLPMEECDSHMRIEGKWQTR